MPEMHYYAGHDCDAAYEHQCRRDVSAEIGLGEIAAVGSHGSQAVGVIHEGGDAAAYACGDQDDAEGMEAGALSTGWKVLRSCHW